MAVGLREFPKHLPKRQMSVMPSQFTKELSCFGPTLETFKHLSDYPPVICPVKHRLQYYAHQLVAFKQMVQASPNTEHDNS